MGGDYFGLGFVLNVEDNASQAFNRVSQHMQNLMQTSEHAFMSMNIAGQTLSQLGSSCLSAGSNIANGFIAIGKGVLSTGDDFEKSRVTLEALYKSAEVARQKMDWAMDFSARTPFEISDVKKALIGFKAVGVEATDSITAVGGKTKEFLSYVGDLGALRPDVGMEGVLMGIRNAIGGDNGKSLKMRLDVDPEFVLGRKLGSTPQQIMQDIADMAQKMAPDLMGKLNGTWSQMISNLEDQKTRFLLAISDSGAFDKAKSTLKYISDNIASIDTTRMMKLGESLGSAFNMIWSPIDFVVRKLVDFVMWAVKLEETNPIIGKMVLGFVALSSALLIGTGLFFKFSGGILMSLGGLGMLFSTMIRFGGITNVFALIGSSLSTLLASIMPIIAVAGLLFLAWKNNFLGIRDMSITFVNNTLLAFSEANRIATMNSADMGKALDNLDKKSFFGLLTLSVVKLRVLWDSLVDAWNDNTLSDENFKKAQQLGLLPLISSILDAKARIESFFKGFSEGFADCLTVAGKIATLIGKAIMSITNYLIPLISKVGELTGLFGKIPTKPFEVIGYAVGVLAGIFVTSKIVSTIVSVGNALWKVFSIGSTLISILGELLPLNAIIGGITSAVTLLAGALGVSIGVASAIVVGIIAVISSIVYMITHWNKVKTVATDVWNSVTNTVKSAWNTIYSTVVNKINEIKSYISTKWGEICTSVTEKLDKITAWFNDLPNKIVKGFNDTKTKIVNWFNDQVTTIRSKLEDWSKAFENWSKDLPNKIKTGLSNAGKAFTKWIQDQDKENRRQYTLWAKSIVDGLVNMGKGIKTQMNQWGKDISNWYQTQKKEIPKRFNEWTKSVSDGFNDMIKNGKKNLDTWGKDISTWFTNKKKDFKKSMTDWGKSISDGWSDIWKNSKKSLSDWGKGISDWFTNTKKDFPKKMSEWGKSIEDGFKNAKTNIMKGLADWWKSISDWFKGIPQKKEVKDSGKDIFKNLLAGMTSEKPTMLDKLGKTIVDVLLALPAILAVVALAVGREIIKRIIEGVIYLKANFGTAFTNLMDYAKQIVTNKIEQIKAKFNFTPKLPSVVTTAMTDALNTVKGIIEKIKSAFNVHLSLPSISIPHIKLPHFSISGKFSMIPPTVPDVGVSWYAKGGIFNSPSVIGVGEAGQEAVLPINKLSEIFADTMTKLPTPPPVINKSVGGSSRNVPTSSDNSIKFESGAIQITMTNGNEQDVDKLVKMIADKLKRQAQMSRVRSYQS